jgi:hypothetical protein
MYLYLYLYLPICIYIYIAIYICAWCRQRRCRGVHTQHTPANMSVYIGVYIGMPAAVSGGVEEYRPPSSTYRYIGIYRCTYIGVQWLPSAAVHMSAHCTQASFLCPLYIPINMPIYIYRYIHCTQASFLPYTDVCVYIYMYVYIYIYIPIYMSAYIDFFSLSFSCLKPCRPRSRDSRVRFHTHTHTHFDLYFFVGCL